MQPAVQEVQIPDEVQVQLCTPEESVGQVRRPESPGQALLPSKSVQVTSSVQELHLLQLQSGSIHCTRSDLEQGRRRTDHDMCF